MFDLNGVFFGVSSGRVNGFHFQWLFAMELDLGGEVGFVL